MAYENGLLNPAFSASTASLNLRRSNTSLNTITNNLYSEADSERLYNTLQRNANNTVNPRLRGHVPVYDNIEPGSHLTSKQDKGTSPQQTSSSQKQKRQRGRRDRIIRVILMGLILFVAVIALLLAVLLVMGKIGPDCPCDSAGASPSTGQQTAENNSSRSNGAQKETFDMDLSPFYDIIEDLQANLSSLRAEAESLLKDSGKNKDALIAAKKELSSTRDAVNLFSDKFYAVVDHVNNSVQQFNPDHGPMFSRLDALNATLTNKLSEIKRTSEQYNDAIDKAIDTMNNTIKEQVNAKISLPGPVGERGKNGSAGPIGDVGQSGPKGPEGALGPQGLQGGKGIPGDNGIPGSNGSKGAQGDKGAKGDIGDTGLTGAEGPAGPAGARGIGDFSWCQQEKASVKLVDMPGQKASASDSQNVKIVAASCTTDVGQEYNLKVTQSGNANTYECECKGVGTTQVGKTNNDVNCILHYLACPIQAP